MPIVEILYGQIGSPEPPPVLRYAAGGCHESALRMNHLQAEEAAFVNLERHGLSQFDSFDPGIKIRLPGRPHRGSLGQDTWEVPQGQLAESPFVEGVFVPIKGATGWLDGCSDAAALCPLGFPNLEVKVHVERKVYQHEMWEVSKLLATFSVDPYLGGMCQDQWVPIGAMLDCPSSWEDVHKVIDCVGQCSLQLGGPVYRSAERDECVMARGEWSSRGRINKVGPLSKFALVPQISYGEWDRASAVGVVYFASLWAQPRRFMTEANLSLYALGGSAVGGGHVEHFAWPLLLEFLGDCSGGRLLPVDAGLKFAGRSLSAQVDHFFVILTFKALVGLCRRCRTRMKPFTRGNTKGSRSGRSMVRDR